MRMRSGGLVLAMALACGSWAARPVQACPIQENERAGRDFREFREELRRSLRDVREDMARERARMIRTHDAARRHTLTFRVRGREMRHEIRAQMHELRDRIREYAQEIRREIRAQFRQSGWI